MMAAFALQQAAAAPPAAGAGWRGVLARAFRLEDVLVALLHIVLILVLAFVAYRVVKLITRRLVQREIAEDDPRRLRQRRQRIETTAGLMNNVAATVIITLAILTALNDLKVPIASLLASVGVAGLAISFGAQSLVKDVITGAFILMEGQFAIGDVIRVGETSGLVERVGLRTTVLRDVYGTVHTIPNGQITQVSNLTKSWSRAVVDVSIGYREDVDRVLAGLRQLVAELAADPDWGSLLLEAPEVPGVESLAESGFVVRVMAKTMPLKQWDVARELRRRIKNRFDAEGIEIPFPALSFYWGDGQLPPALARADALASAAPPDPARS
jgi:small-conductance mechanosensitive channel